MHVLTPARASESLSPSKQMHTSAPPWRSWGPSGRVCDLASGGHDVDDHHHASQHKHPTVVGQWVIEA